MSREFWNEFIQIYKSFPCLWDTKSPLYGQKQIRKDAYGILLAKVREIDTSATVDSVKKKIDSFRTAFRREERKVMQSSFDDEETYTPTLWYYRDLQEILGHNVNEFNKKQSVCEESIQSDDDANLLVERLESLSDDSDYSYQTPPPPPAKKQKTTTKKKERPRLFPMLPDSKTDKKDDCSTFTANLELQLREISVEQKYIAQKLISDVMFLARTNRLNYNSSVNVNSSEKGTSKTITGKPVLIIPRKTEDNK